MTSGAVRTIWWLDGGDEQCRVCHQRYAYEVEYRCVDCDAPICPFCVITVRRTRRSYCPGCDPDPKRRS
jgi:hypothetical protein